jgi:iron complex transport system permease protein
VTTAPATLRQPAGARGPRPGALALLAVATAGLVVVSLFVGGFDIDLAGLVADPEQLRQFLVSRVPRTLAIVFAATAMSMSGVVMQLLTQNRFVEPTTAGTTQWAGLGMLVALLLWPNAPFLARLVLATAFALVGTLAFMGIIQRIRDRDKLMVPLVGIMLGAVVGAVSTFLAIEFDLLQSMGTWRSAGFSGIVRGFYEPLWLAAIVAIAIYVLADRLTLAGLGRDVATNAGLDYRAAVLLGTSAVALCTGVTSVVVGFLPFLGLIVPNLVSMVMGDDLKRSLPWVALTGTSILLLCDIVGRLIVAPMEIPVSVILGVIGSVVFLAIALRRPRGGRRAD